MGSEGPIRWKWREMEGWEVGCTAAAGGIAAAVEKEEVAAAAEVGFEPTTTTTARSEVLEVSVVLPKLS